MKHVFLRLRCNINRGDRMRNIGKYIVKDDDDDCNMVNILANLNDEKMRDILLFVLGTIKIRNFIKAIEM